MNACQDSESVLFRCHNSVMPQIITLMKQAQCCVHWSYSHKGNWQQSLPGWSLHLSVLANTLEECYQCIVNEINCSSVKPNKMNWTSIKTKGVISFEKISYSQLYILPVVGFFFFFRFFGGYCENRIKVRLCFSLFMNRTSPNQGSLLKLGTGLRL